MKERLSQGEMTLSQNKVNPGTEIACLDLLRRAKCKSSLPVSEVGTKSSVQLPKNSRPETDAMEKVAS